MTAQEHLENQQACSGTMWMATAQPGLEAARLPSPRQNTLAQQKEFQLLLQCCKLLYFTLL